jgi:hypothetical protein
VALVGDPLRHHQVRRAGGVYDRGIDPAVA